MRNLPDFINTTEYIEEVEKKYNIIFVDCIEQFNRKIELINDDFMHYSGIGLKFSFINYLNCGLILIEKMSTHEEFSIHVPMIAIKNYTTTDIIKTISSAIEKHWR